jgi:hypothetical protein
MHSHGLDENVCPVLNTDLTREGHPADELQAGIRLPIRHIPQNLHFVTCLPLLKAGVWSPLSNKCAPDSSVSSASFFNTPMNVSCSCTDKFVCLRCRNVSLQPLNKLKQLGLYLPKRFLVKQGLLPRAIS